MRWRLAVGGLCCAFLLYTTAVADVLAETGSTLGKDAQNKDLVQKGLTLYEIDQELARIALEDKKLTAAIGETDTKINWQSQSVSDTRKNAEKVLRAYYAGERDSIGLLILSAKSISDALFIADYMTMVLNSDDRKLKDYLTAYQQMKELQSKQKEDQNQLKAAKENYTAMRAEWCPCSRNSTRSWREKNDSRQVLDDIRNLTSLWQTKGIPAYRKYLMSLSEQMQNISELLSSNASKTTSLSVNGVNYVFQMSDTDLNDFLRKKKDPLFNTLTFRFIDGHVQADGRYEDMNLSIRGHYALNNTGPKTIVQFYVDELKFNGFTLPATTSHALEQEVKMGIEPQKIAAFFDSRRYYNE